MKKILLFAAAGLLTTATIVYATVDKKPAVKEEVKKESVKKETKENTNHHKAGKRNCSWF
jgi:hypothetical protein